MKWLIATVFALVAPLPAFAQGTCDYAGQSYSVGATVCECPSLSGEGGLASGGAARVTSRRLACFADGWKDAGTVCVDLTYAHSSASATEDFDRYNAQYCPRLPVNFAEIQKAITQETGKFIDAAPKATIIFIVETICKRYKLEATCKAVVDALTGMQSK